MAEPGIEPIGDGRAERGELYKEEFAGLDHPFTDGGFRAFLDTTDDFIVSLAAESARTASRRGGDAIDSSDVESAGQYLYSGRRQRAASQSGTVGGILLGISGSGFFSWYVADQPTDGVVISSAILLLIGAAMVVWNFAADWSRR